MAIRGHLQEMSLPTLVQLTCQEGNQARLSISHDEAEAILYFEQGNIVHAELNDQIGEEVVYRVLAWEDGEFSLETGAVPPSHSIEAPWSMLLMGGLQRRDEKRWDSLDIEQIEEEYEMAENMNNILKEMGEQVTGFVATAVVGMDGLGIAEYTNSSVNMESINAQMTLLLKLVDTTVTKLGAGAIEDYLLTTEKAYLLIRFLSDRGYYVGVTADRQKANLGNMRLTSRIFGERLSRAMPH